MLAETRPGAVDRGRSVGEFVAQFLDRMLAEDRVPQAAREALAKLGHTVETLGAWGAGGAVQLIQFDRENGVLRGGTDPRPGGLALGF